MKFLFCTKGDGKPSASKTWKTIAFAVGTYVVLRQQEVSADLLGIYLAVVGGAEVASRWVERGKE